MAKQRVKMTAAQYVSTPGPTKPAMRDIDAVELMADMVRMRMDIPTEVRTAAMAQINENVTEGWILVPEEYHGRLRIVATEKS